MTYYVDYPLSDGFIHNWLVLGPHATSVEEMAQFQGDDFKLQIAHHYHQAESGIDEAPVDFAVVSALSTPEDELRWRSTRCLDDHYVDVSTFYHTPHYLRTWAYSELLSTTGQDITLKLTTNGPADIWINETHVTRVEHFRHQLPLTITTPAKLEAGQNRILVRFEGVALRECPYVMALQLIDFESGEENPVRIPLAVEAIKRYHKLENIFQQAYLERDVYLNDDRITIRWPVGMSEKDQYAVRLVKPPRRIYAELQEKQHDGNDRPMMRAFEVPDDSYELVFMPDPQEYYERNVRIQRRLRLETIRNKYSDRPYGSYVDRRNEALKDAGMRNLGLYTEIARMQGNWWANVKPQSLLEAIEGVNQRRDCSDFSLIGLLGMHYRFGEHEKFPAEVKQPLEDCLLNFRYWLDEPGDDAMCFWSENHQILFHACEILAGQLYPDRVFGNSGLTGKEHVEKGERLALAWLQKRAQYGFQEWDSNCYFEHDIAALSHLLDLAENQEVWELAAIVLDKIFMTIALNSYKGVFGSTHGRSYTPHVKGGYLENTSGLSRLMWGQGVFNKQIMGTVCMACCENYELPAIIAALAIDLPAEGMWSKERHAGTFDPAVDCKSGAWEVNKVTYKTADYMLCSAQDYHPGEAGYQQHLWQATFSPDAVVFVNHPPCLSEDGAHRPGFWHGNVVLPRVAQWKDVLIALYNLPDDDWLNFTHAYFPRYAFDAHQIKGGWVFGCKGDGYIALTASNGLKLTQQGQNAFRELRSYGQQTVWLCQMGRKSEDGSFKAFRDKVLKANLNIDGLSVDYTSLRGDTIRFGWDGPLTVNDEAQPLNGFNHYDGPHVAAEWPASIIAMGYGQELVRLNVG